MSDQFLFPIRYFLDKVVDRLVELQPGQGTLVGYLGGYTDYLAAQPAPAQRK